jgi:SAM-dependent methyltransferase
MNDEGHGRPASDKPTGLRPRWAKALFRLTPWGLRRGLGRLESVTAEFGQRLVGSDLRFDAVEHTLREIQQSLSERCDALEGAIASIQGELERLRDDRAVRIERRLDPLERELSKLSGEITRLRDQVVPAVVDRGNILIDRLSEELEEVASLVERMLLDEPLRVPASEGERQLASVLDQVQPRLLEAFRGTEAEIRHRLEHHLAKLSGRGPVLDLGCGRGELLLLLREAGVEATGIEVDPARAQATRRRGLRVIEGDVLDVVRDQPDEAWGAITAIHLLEHLAADRLLGLLAEARRVLRPGGVLLAECPNPHSLRVGGALYWCDPTHVRPLLPELLQLYLKTTGFEVRGIEYLHPFPVEQRLASSDAVTDPESPPELAALGARLDRLASRLDELLNGPRDFAVLAGKPGRG